MESFTGHALEWLTAYTFVVVFIGVLIDATGVPFPGRLLLVAAGAMTRGRWVSLAVIITLAVAAAMAMDSAWYLAGRRGGDRVMALYRKLPGWPGRRGRRRDDPMTEIVERYGAATIPIGRFVLSVRALAWPLVATRGVGYGKFLLLDLAAAIAWASLWVLLGATVGSGWAAAAETAGGWMVFGGVVAFTAIALAVAVHLWRRRSAARLCAVAAHTPSIVRSKGR